MPDLTASVHKVSIQYDLKLTDEVVVFGKPTLCLNTVPVKCKCGRPGEYLAFKRAQIIPCCADHEPKKKPKPNQIVAQGKVLNASNIKPFDLSKELKNKRK
jgi:hypothetical protein